MAVNKKWFFILCAGLAVLLVCVLSSVKNHGLLMYGSFITEKKEILQDYVAHHYTASLVIFMIIFILLVLCAIPLIAVFTCLGGFLFGTAVGACAAVISATIGATLFFVVMRYYCGSWVQRTYKDELRSFNDHIAQHGVFYLLSLRFVVVIPFCVVNMLASMTHISIPTFMATTVIGVIPGDIIYAFVGSQCGSITSLSDVYSGQCMGALLLLAFFSLCPVAISYIKSKICIALE